jgi:hypothetical protein
LRRAKARPVSTFAVAKVAIQRIFSRNGQQIDWPEPRSVHHGVYGNINGKDVFASAATETNLNVMSKAFARQCGLDITSPMPNQQFLLANDKMVDTVGTVTAEWFFRREKSTKTTLQFMVLDRTSWPVILGAELLQRTRTIDFNWHRLQTTSTEAEDFSCVHIFGDLSNSITGRLNSVPISALAATGCEVNLVSMRFIEDNGLQFKCETPLEEHWLKMIDGSLVPVQSTVFLDWKFGDEKHAWRAEFVVLPDLPCDVILGQQFLYGSCAFFGYADCFRTKRPTKCKSGIGAMPGIFLAFSTRKGELSL